MSKQVLLSYAGLSTSQNVTFMFTVCKRRRISKNQTHSMMAPELVINIHEPGELIQRWQRTGWSFIYSSQSTGPPCRQGAQSPLAHGRGHAPLIPRVEPLRPWAGRPTRERDSRFPPYHVEVHPNQLHPGGSGRHTLRSRRDMERCGPPLHLTSRTTQGRCQDTSPPRRRARRAALRGAGQ